MRIEHSAEDNLKVGMRIRCTFRRGYADHCSVTHFYPSPFPSMAEMAVWVCKEAKHDVDAVEKDRVMRSVRS